MKRVSELITIDEIKKWNNDSIITIKAGTGQGKSYFIKNILYAFAKKNNQKILFLIHRTNCVNQFQEEITSDNKDDVIEIMTYQKLEYMYKNNYDVNFNDYQYIVCDEFHYFMSDASFNKTTDMSLNLILSQQDKVRIFMSATGDYMKQYIKNRKNLHTNDYELQISFNFIRELTFFNKDCTMESFIEEAIKTNQKGIFFIQSARKAYELYLKYKDYALFNCSKNNKDYYKHVDSEKIDNMLKNEKFEELILITTCCMDAGVNIIDEDVKHIVCDVKDISVLVQCIGRKRIQNKKDKIYLYIKTITNQQLGGIETQLTKKVKMAKFLRDNTVEAYIEKYKRELDYSHIVYDDTVGEKDKGTKKVNELMYFKCITDLNEISVMKTHGDFSFCKTLAHKFGFYDMYEGYKYRIIEEGEEKMKLEDYLNSIIDKKLFNDDQQELSDLIIKELVTISSKTDYRTKKLKPSTLEAIIRDQLELPYAISKPKKETTGDMRGKRYITITKLN